jgi:hypothetical protein
MKDRQYTAGLPSRGMLSGMLSRTLGRSSRARVFFLAALMLVPAASAFAGMEEAPRSFSLAGETKRLEPIQRKTLPKVQVELLLAQDRAKTVQIRQRTPAPGRPWPMAAFGASASTRREP